MTPCGGKRIQSLAKAMQIMDILARSRTALSLSELEQRSTYPKSTLHGLLTTMRDYDVIEQTADGKYRLGFRLFEYGCLVSDSMGMTKLARPHLRHLATQTGETAFLSVKSGFDVINVEQAEGSSSLHIVPAKGVRLPMHCTSQGKLFLALCPTSAHRKLFESGLSQAFTPHTIITDADFDREADQIRTQGYAIENGEFKIGLRSVSAPIFDGKGTVRYAVGVVGMYRHIQSEEFVKATSLVTETAQQLSSQFGYRSDFPPLSLEI